MLKGKRPGHRRHAARLVRDEEKEGPEARRRQPSPQVRSCLFFSLVPETGRIPNAHHQASHMAVPREEVGGHEMTRNPTQNKRDVACHLQSHTSPQKAVETPAGAATFGRGPAGNA